MDSPASMKGKNTAAASRKPAAKPTATGGQPGPEKLTERTAPGTLQHAEKPKAGKSKAARPPTQSHRTDLRIVLQALIRM